MIINKRKFDILVGSKRKKIHEIIRLRCEFDVRDNVYLELIFYTNYEKLLKQTIKAKITYDRYQTNNP